MAMAILMIEALGFYHVSGGKLCPTSLPGVLAVEALLPTLKGTLNALFLFLPINARPVFLSLVGLGFLDRLASPLLLSVVSSDSLSPRGCIRR